MDDSGRSIAALRDELTPVWDEAHAQRLLAGIDRLQRRRRLKLRAGGWTLAAACVLALGIGRGYLPEAAQGSQLSAAVSPRIEPAASAVARDPIALMEAAAAARAGDRPEEAVACLRRVLAEHARSPVAPFAAFTLGRVLLESLGQPAEAAEAFALARSYAPEGGSLAQDALAREVEAYSKAGHSREAYERGQLYQELYPSGRRLRAVRLFGGLE